MRVLVTGGAGYIGSVTVAALLESGHDVAVYDSLEKGHRAAVAPGARLTVGGLADGEAVLKALRAHRAEAVIHFAAYSLVGESMGRPADYFLNNVSNSLTLLEAMRAAGTGRIVFSSSAAVYGSMYHALPYGCSPYYTSYYYCGGMYYEPRYEGDTVVYVTVPDPAQGQPPPPQPPPPQQ